MKYKKIGIVGRFKPLHLGGASLLSSACENADEVIIGIGSSNKYNVRNPFTAEESKEMIDEFLKKKYSNYNIIFVPDFGHLVGCEDGQKWKEYVFEKFGQVEVFVSGNDFVKNLLKEKYKVLNPEEIIPKDKSIKLRASLVRNQMAKGEDWESLVPSEVADYLIKHKLVERFNEEFGKETLDRLKDVDLNKIENLEEEKKHPLEK